MRKFIFYTLGFCVVGFFLTACYDDKGNYDYTELAEIRIDTAGLATPILAEGTVFRFDKMMCEPNIYYAGKLVNEDADAPLDYTWTIYSTTGLGGSDDDRRIDTLATTRILDAEISRAPGQYIVQLAVTDRGNGCQQYMKLQRTIEGTIPVSGWMLLYEPVDKPGMSDVGLVYNELVKKNWLSDDVAYWNLYSSSNGAPVEGKPLKINYTVTKLPTSFIVIATEKGMCAVHEETFQRELTVEDFFYEPPTSGALTAYMQACWMPSTPSYGENVLYGNKVYIGGNGERPMGIPAMGEYGELAPWLCLFHPVSGLNTVVYDNTNGRFLGVSGVKVTPLIAQTPPSGGFDVNNVGAEFIKGDWGVGNMEYFIMKKDDAYFFARANFLDPASTAMGTIWKDITASPGIAEINTFAMPYVGSYAFYGTKTKVYKLFYTMNDVAEELWEIPSGANSNEEEITCMELQKFSVAAWMSMGIMPNVNEVLHVATWNESTKKGKLYQFKIDAIDGSIKGEPKVCDVPGKVKSMGWKFTLMER
ncbi:MAG: hypothetical protein K2I90_01690 [Odoribacter sp.]|nr:hypothetical protein [Odoribacter sp.]